MNERQNKRKRKYTLKQNKNETNMKRGMINRNKQTNK